MSTIRVRLDRLGACEVTHAESGAVIHTDAPSEFGGAGQSFSATDLLAAALGACVATTIDTVAVRHGIPLGALELVVRKELASAPKRVVRLDVDIHVRHPVQPDVIARIDHAARACVVHRALDPNLPVAITVIQNDAPGGDGRR